MNLDGKVALVTGASRGIGAATAVALAEAGCAVACAARSTTTDPRRTPGTLDDTVRRVRAVGGTAIAVPTNLAEEEQVEAMVHATAEHFGRLDVLVNNAAITFVGDLDIPMHRHNLVMAVNFHAPFVATRVAAPLLRARGGGAVLNISSVAALYPHDGLMSYGLSKLALERFTIDVARQLAPSGVAVNCFRIDLPVASEGFIANMPGLDRSTWEPCEVAAEGIVWMLSQPPEYTGRRESMYQLREREGIMKSRAARPWTGAAPSTELINGLAGVPAASREPF